MKYLAKMFFQETPFFYTFVKNSKSKRQLHNHDFYEIFLTLTDDFVHIVNDVEYILPQGTLVFIRPWDNHSNHNPDTAHAYIQIGYTEAVAAPLFTYLETAFNLEKLRSSQTPPSFTLSSQDFNTLLRSLKKIETLDINNKSELNKYYINLLYHIFAEYFSKYAQSETKDFDIPKWLIKVCKQAQTDKLFIDGIDAIVEASGKSYQHFARSLKQYYDKSPSEFVMDLRLSYAYNLITTTNFSITDICYLVGFNNPSYFYKNFIKEYEKTPTQIRKDTLVLM